MKQAIQKKQVTTVRSLAAQPEIQARFRQLLGSRANQFLTTVISVANSMPVGVEPKSVLAAAAISASLDLPVHPSLGQSWIIPYGKEATFQLGYKGLIQLALRTGQYQHLNACPVREGQLAKHDTLTGEVKLHDGDFTGKPVVGYAAFMRLVNGFSHAEYRTVAEIEAHAVRFSKAYKSKSSPWQTDKDKMGMKTVLKQLISVYGPTSIDMERAIVSDGAVIDAETEQATAYPDNPSDQAEPEQDGDLGPVKQPHALQEELV